MLSGVGPRAQLDKFGIPVVSDLPGVGQNLQDHLLAPCNYTCTKPVSLASAEEPEELEKFAQGMGMLTSNFGEAGGFATVLPDSAYPDLQWHFGPTYWLWHNKHGLTGHGFALGAILAKPKSVGFVELASANPLDYVLI